MKRKGTCLGHGYGYDDYNENRFSVVSSYIVFSLLYLFV